MDKVTYSQTHLCMFVWMFVVCDMYVNLDAAQQMATMRSFQGRMCPFSHEKGSTDSSTGTAQTYRKGSGDGPGQQDVPASSKDDSEESGWELAGRRPKRTTDEDAGPYLFTPHHRFPLPSSPFLLSKYSWACVSYRTGRTIRDPISVFDCRQANRDCIRRLPQGNAVGVLCA